MRNALFWVFIKTLFSTYDTVIDTQGVDQYGRRRYFWGPSTEVLGMMKLLAKEVEVSPVAACLNVDKTPATPDNTPSTLLGYLDNETENKMKKQNGLELANKKFLKFLLANFGGESFDYEGFSRLVHLRDMKLITDLIDETGNIEFFNTFAAPSIKKGITPTNALELLKAFGKHQTKVTTGNKWGVELIVKSLKPIRVPDTKLMVEIMSYLSQLKGNTTKAKQILVYKAVRDSKDVSIITRMAALIGKSTSKRIWSSYANGGFSRLKVAFGWASQDDKAPVTIWNKGDVKALQDLVDSLEGKPVLEKVEKKLLSIKYALKHKTFTVKGVTK